MSNIEKLLYLFKKDNKTDIEKKEFTSLFVVLSEDELKDFQMRIRT